MPIPTTRKTAEAVIAGVSKWFGIFGVPKEILADQGQGFEAEEFQRFLKEKGVDKKRSSPYHPQGNGRAEKSVDIIKAKIRCLLGEKNLPVEKWVSVVDEAMLGANTSKNRVTGMSPFQGMMGRRGNLTEDRIWGTIPEETGGAEIAEQNILVSREEQVQEHLEREGDGKIPTFLPGQEVLLKKEEGKYKKLRPKFRKGYTVVRKIGPVNWVIRNASGKEKVYHYSKLREAGTRWSRTNPMVGIVPVEVKPDVVQRYPRRERRAPDRLHYSTPGGTDISQRATGTS